MRTGHAWRADAFGEPAEQLRWVPVTWSDPGHGRLLVEVRAVGVGLPDKLMVQGRYPLTARPPVSPGQEVCGTVVEVAAGSRFRVGDRVMGLTPFAERHGGYGDHAYVRESKASLVPDTMDDRSAAGFMLAYRTAYASLVRRVPLEAGETLAVLGATGSSGLAAIGLGRALGATVVAVAGGPEKVEFCRVSGADAAIDHRVADVGAALLEATDGRGVDVVFDPVGGDLARQATGALRSGGRVAVVGYASGRWIYVPAADLAIRNHALVGVFTGGFDEDEDRAINDELAGLVAAGRIGALPGPVRALADVPRVVQDLGAGAAPGKIVVER